jgi:Fic family protein
MQTLILIIVGIVAVGLGYWLGRNKSKKGGCVNNNDAEKKTGLIEQQAEEKKRNLEAILGLMRSGNQPLTNNDVEAMLGIPESTVTRYFDELEKAGKVRQIGQTGRDVAYELK